MTPESLFTICLVCMLILVAVVILNCVWLYYMRMELKNQRSDVDTALSKFASVGEDMDILMSKINAGIKYKIDTSAISILDLEEFKGLDPKIKQLYRRYIIDALAPAFVDSANRYAMEGRLDENREEIDAAVYSIAKKIRSDGIGSVVARPTACCMNVDTNEVVKDCSGSCDRYGRMGCVDQSEDSCIANRSSCDWSDSKGCTQKLDGLPNYMMQVEDSKCAVPNVALSNC